MYIFFMRIYNPHLLSFHGYIYQTYQICMYPIWSCPAEPWQGDVAALRALIEDGHEAWPYLCRISGGFCDLYECNRRNLNNPGSKPMKSRSGVGQTLWETLTKKKPMKWGAKEILRVSQPSNISLTVLRLINCSKSIDQPTFNGTLVDELW